MLDVDWYANLIEAMAVGVVVRDPEGTPVLANQRALDLVGIDRSMLSDPATLQATVQAFRATGEVLQIGELPAHTTLRTGAPVLDFMVGIPAADGGTRWLSVDVVPFSCGLWDEPGTVATLRDATELHVGRQIDQATQLLATRLAEAPLGDAGGAVADVLAETGRVSGAALAVELFIDRQAGTARPAAQWRRSRGDGVPPPTSSDVPLDQLVWLLGRLARREVVMLPALAGAPEEAALVAAAMQTWGLAAATIVPVVAGERPVAALVLGWAHAHEPDERVVRFASVAAGLLGALSERERSHAELRALNARLDQRLRSESDELARTEARSQALVDALPDLIFEVDADGRFVDVHLPPDAPIARDRDVYLGRSLEEVVPEPLRAEAFAAIDRARQGSTTEVLEFRLDVDGRERGFECRWVRLGNGGMLAIVRDVTEQIRQADDLYRQSTALRAANEDLRDAVRAKDDFLATMRHELRTPLSAILGMSEILLEGSDDPITATQRDALLAIQESGGRLLQLVDDLLDLNRLDGDVEPMRFVLVELEAVTRIVVELVRSRAERKGLTLALNLEGPVAVRGDEQRLRQVLQQLLDNAVKFTAPGGRVGVDLVCDRDEARLTVWDTGIGIADADRSRVFEPFLQLDATTARPYEGTGVGLALVDRLVKRHGGRVELESDAGSGSRFTVVLPLAR